MSRDPTTGEYTAPASAVNPAVTRTKISSSAFNALVDDIETALNGVVLFGQGQTIPDAEKLQAQENIGADFVVSVDNYGAESGGDASALNTAFQAAIDALPSGNAIATGEGNGGTILVKPGDYSNLDPASLVLPANFTVNWDATGATLPANVPGLVNKAGVFSLAETYPQANRNVLVQNYSNIGTSLALDNRHYAYHVNAFVSENGGADNEFRAFSFNVETNTVAGAGSVYGIKGRVAADGGGANIRALYGYAEAKEGSNFTGNLTGCLATIETRANPVGEAIAVRAHVGDGATAAYEAAGGGGPGATGISSFGFRLRTGTGQPFIPSVAGYFSHGGGTGDQFLGYESHTDSTTVFRVVGNSAGGSTNSGAVLTSKYMRVGSTSAPANTTAGDLTVVRLNIGNVTQVQPLTVAGAGSLTGYLRVGSNTAPTNTTAGDLTVVRLNVGNVTQVQDATISGDMSNTGYLRVGSNTAPANTTAGDLTISRLSIGNASLSGYLARISGSMTGVTSPQGLNIGATIQSDATSAPSYVATVASTAAASFNVTQIRHYSCAQGTIGAGSSVSQQWGFYADSSLTGASNNMGFYGAIAAAANRWNVYMVGTARNYMAGALSIGALTDPGSGGLFVNGGVTSGSTTLWTTTVALTNGAAAGAGTLSNAPVAGNPTKWIPINDNGTTRYIPAW